MNSDDTLEIDVNRNENFVNTCKANSDNLIKCYSSLTSSNTAIPVATAATTTAATTTTAASTVTVSNSEVSFASSSSSPKRIKLFHQNQINEINDNNLDDNNGNSSPKSTASVTSSSSLNKNNDILHTNCIEQINRVKLSAFDMENLSKTDLIEKWRKQELYIDLIEKKLHQQQQQNHHHHQHHNHQQQTSNTDYLKSDTCIYNSNKENGGYTNCSQMDEDTNESKAIKQIQLTQRESILVMKLTTKEHEITELMSQVNDLKHSRIPSRAQLEATSVDPAVELMFEKMRKSLDTAKAKLEDMQSELNAWKFTPDSTLGKRLMTKCRLLHQENEELGKLVSSGRIAKLEGDLALQKSFSEEMKKSQSELDEFLLELDEDVEGMQNTIVYLQTQLKESREQIATLEKELNFYKSESEVVNKS